MAMMKPSLFVEESHPHSCGGGVCASLGNENPAMLARSRLAHRMTKEADSKYRIQWCLLKEFCPVISRSASDEKSFELKHDKISPFARNDKGALT